jgi:hypothetical protein
MGYCRGARQAPRLHLMAEVCWDLEWTLQQQGFDHCSDKRLYDHLREGLVGRDHLRAGLDYQDKLARFLEDHGEPGTSANSTGEAGGPPRVTTVSESKAAGGSNWLNAKSRAFHIFRAPRLVVGGIDPALSTEALLCSGGLNPRASALSVSACPTNLPPISTSTGRGFSPGRWRAWPPPQSLRRSPDCG